MVEINSMPLVSVILPVYLGEDYIKETIRCILSQTYTKIELLVIDDGSPDKSGSIADEAASLDARLTVFHQPHRGVSAARNVGLEHARGDYICFIDCDDHVYGDMIRMMVMAMEKKHADMSIFNVFDENERGLGGLLGWHIKSRDIPSDMIKARLFLGLDPQVWRKVYRAHLWENVRFPEDVLYEDLYVNSEVLLNAKKLIATDQVLYDNNHYNEKSVSALEKEPRILHELKAWMHNLNLARKIPVLSAYREYYRWQALRCWAKCNGTLGEEMFQGNSAIYDVLFTALPLADAIRPAPQSDRNTLLYYMAEVEAMTLAITMLKQCGLECHHEVRDMFQAAVPALCIDSIMHILRPASRELLLCAIEEARRYKRRLNFGQRFMMAMIGKGPKDVLELKGRQYLKRGISK